jgi:Patched family
MLVLATVTGCRCRAGGDRVACVVGHVTLAYAGVVAALLAILGAFGLLSLLGSKFVNLSSVMPFLVLGKRISDVSWLVCDVDSACKKKTVPARRHATQSHKHCAAGSRQRGYVAEIRVPVERRKNRMVMEKETMFSAISDSSGERECFGVATVMAFTGCSHAINLENRSLKTDRPVHSHQRSFQFFLQKIPLNYSWILSLSRFNQFTQVQKD